VILHENSAYDRELLYRWKSQQTADPENAFLGKAHMKPDEAYVRQLERELKRAQEDRDILKKPWLLLEKQTMKYRFIHDHEYLTSVQHFCDLLQQVSRSAYYNWQHATVTVRA
jgi:transposase-like protein